jgi:meiotically up-regulated gene 157 (Mug157) protein
VSELGFVSSEENPADDAAELPFPLSAQLLYWLAASRLAELDDDLCLERHVAATARRLAAAIARHFEVDGPFGRQWAYEIDARGRHRLYQDANDLPTALAPLLGFCGADDPSWRATMRFAFSDRNPGFCPGPFGGLGSHHTPGTWTLGDVQQWVAASLTDEPDVAERALERLLASSTPDGLLPEAYDSAGGGAPIRRWFAWPGAALGTLLALAS